MTLIAMCRRVLAEVGWEVPSSIASNTDATAQQIFAIANTELRMISQSYDWPQLEVEYTFPTVDGQTSYPWPSDFRKVAFGGVFNTAQYYRIRGGANVEQWNKYKYGLLGSVSYLRFRETYTAAGAPAMELSPSPNAGETLVSFYFSKEYARNNAGTSQELYVADSDVSKVPEELVELGVKWRFRRAKGLDYSAELAEYNTIVRQQFAAYRATGDVPVGGPRYLIDGLTCGYVPDNGFGA